MNTKRTRLLVAVGLMLVPLILAVLACGGSGRGEVSTPDNGSAATIAAQSAELTQLASGAQPGTGPQETQPPQPAPKETQPPQGPVQSIISATMDTNCREGPLPDYPKVGAFLVGQTSTVHGVNANQDWWYIENPKAAGQYCWVWGETTQVTGDTSALQVVEPPPLVVEQPGSELPEGACVPPYEFTSWDEDVKVWWDKSDQGKFLNISAAAIVGPPCPDVPVHGHLEIMNDHGVNVYSAEVSTVSDSSGRATVSFNDINKKSMARDPILFRVVWSFEDPAYGEGIAFTGDIPSP